MRTLFAWWGKSEFKPVSSREVVLLSKEWGWIFAAGLFFMVLGAVALATPAYTTLAISLTIATLLIIGGSAYLFQAIKLRGHRGTPIRLLQSALSLITGLLIWRYPGGGMLGVAIGLSFYFFLGGAFQWSLATAMRPHSGWGLGIVGALASFLLGGMLLFTFPFSAIWLPGAFLGIDLIISGSAMIGFSVSVRAAGKAKIKPVAEVESVIRRAA